MISVKVGNVKVETGRFGWLASAMVLLLLISTVGVLADTFGTEKSQAHPMFQIDFGYGHANADLDMNGHYLDNVSSISPTDKNLQIDGGIIVNDGGDCNDGYLYYDGHLKTCHDGEVLELPIITDPEEYE